jgi:AraC-like DNA-binding protein
VTVPIASANTGRAFSIDRFIEGARALVPVGGQLDHAWLPDGRTSLVFRVFDGGRGGDLAVAGPQTHALFKSVRGVTRATIVQLKPGWCGPLLGVPAHELTDRIVRIEDLWGRAGSDLYAEILATHDLPALMECLSRAIGPRALEAREPASARLARRGARLLDDGDARVEHVAEQLGVTSRHLRRAFTENIGVGPKEYARTARLQRAIRLAATSRGWGRIATDAGYYDQAHFIADFRAFVGETPGAFLRRSVGTTQSATGSCEGQLRGAGRVPTNGTHGERYARVLTPRSGMSGSSVDAPPLRARPFSRLGSSND